MAIVSTSFSVSTINSNYFTVLLYSTLQAVLSIVGTADVTMIVGLIICIGTRIDTRTCQVLIDYATIVPTLQPMQELCQLHSCVAYARIVPTL